MGLEHRFKDEWLLRAVLGLPGIKPEAVEKFRKEGRPYLAQSVIQAGLAAPEVMAETVSRLYGVTYLDVTDAMVQKMALALVPERVCKMHHLIPVDLDGEKIVVAMTDPIDQQALADVQAVSGRQPAPYYCLQERIDQLIAELYSPEQVISGLVDRLSESASVEVIEGLKPESEDETPDVIRAPVIKLANSIISKAVKMRASDIHIEHEERASAVRFRIDGMLRNVMVLPRQIASTMLVSRIKIMSGLDLTEHRRPQDGRAKLRVYGAEIGLRVSTLPTAYGEKIVIRILDKRAAEVPFEKLGFKPELSEKIVRLLGAAQGIFLVTGPTGSGKTTTLYSILNKVKAEDTNIVTAEDPIEYKLPGINQVQVNEKAGLTFAAVLRSVLRQDPDIILVGEVRDKETADIAFQAALTGHLVLSTLHTNDTVSTVARLVDMGVERFKLAPGLIAITAQRLARRLCACRERVPEGQLDPAATALLKKYGIPPAAYKPKGCEACDNLGYRGRLSIMELLEVNEALKERIMAGVEESALRQYALASGALYPLSADAAWHIAQGDITLEEILPYIKIEEELKPPETPKAPLPAASVGAAPSAPPAPKAPAQGESKKRVLVTDDDQVIRVILRQVLAKEGFEVVEAVDGVKALERLAVDVPDLLLCDINMPNLDGFGVIRGARESLGLQDLPIIVLTAESEDASQEQALQLGADDYVLKPVKPNIVLARIRALFRRRAAAAA